MIDRVGILGGTTVGDLLGDELRVETRWGDVTVSTGTLGGARAFFVPRHGPEHERPPHRVDHRANVSALLACGVERVLAVHTVGALGPDPAPGTIVVPHDLVDWAGLGPTLFDDAVVHVDLSSPFCPEVRAALVEAGGGDARDGGVYVQTRGPRFETLAEARYLAGLGDLVGMTAAHEATVAREAGLCYASLCLVTNDATDPAGVSLAGLLQAVEASEDRVLRMLEATVAAVPGVRGCRCGDAPEVGHLA